MHIAPKGMRRMQAPVDMRWGALSQTQLEVINFIVGRIQHQSPSLLPIRFFLITAPVSSITLRAQGDGFFAL